MPGNLPTLEALGPNVTVKSITDSNREHRSIHLETVEAVRDVRWH